MYSSEVFYFINVIIICKRIVLKYTFLDLKYTTSAYSVHLIALHFT